MLRLNNEETNKCFSPGFTLVELMIVMVVISILVGVTIPIAKYVTRRAREANQRIYIEKIKSALEDYRAAYGEYPITPVTNDSGQVTNPDDVARHYPATFDTTIFDTNSPFTNFFLTDDTVEDLKNEDVDLSRKIDYSLTYPLMLRQLAEGARPFMEFKNVAVAYLVYRTPGPGDTYDDEQRRRKKSGGFTTIFRQGLKGKPIVRPKAIDPVTMKQWKYVSEAGITYTLTTNSF